MRTMTKLMLGLVAPAALLAGESAFAAKINNWTYENIAGFTAFTSLNPGNPGPVTGSAPNNAVYTIAGAPANPIPGAPTVLSWGIPQTAGGQSRLRLGADKVGPSNVVTDGAFVPDLDLFHDNFVINLDQSLRTATLTAALVLEAVAPPAGNFGPLVGLFNIQFTETDNAGPCPTGGTPCADVFVLDVTGSSPLSLFLGQIEDYKYTLNVGLPDLQLLDAGACTAAGVAAGCVGFVTQEGQTSEFNVLFNITSEFVPPTQVPEPGMIALLGLGLAGVGFGQIRRRK